MAAYRIFIADDHPLFREGLKRALTGKGDTEVVGEADDGRKVLKCLDQLALEMKTPQLIILDISMPGPRGIEIIEHIKAAYPEMKILMLTMHEDKEHFYQSMSAGADGYFVKNEPEQELFVAIKRIQRGKRYVSRCISAELTENLDQVWERFQRPVLTAREIEVTKLIAEGKSNKEIGVVLSISVHTVEHHRANVMKKLDLRSTADIVRYAIDKGYL